MCPFALTVKNVLEKCACNCAVAYWDDKNVYKTLSYQEVNLLKEHVKANITNVIVISENHECIGLYMEHNHYIPSLIISLQECDLAFTFLDPYASFENNLNIIKRLNMKWIISHNQNTNFLSAYFSEVTEFGVDFLKLWKTNLVIEVTHLSETICYVICSSGSTGEPKIIKAEHECIFSNVNSLRKIFELTQNDVIHFGTPLTFDPSMIELFLALTTGCALLIAPQKIKLNPSRLFDTLFPKDCKLQKGVTVLQMVPSLFRRWGLSNIEFILQESSCRILAFGGENFPEIILNFKKSERLRIFNLYGITEVSCWATVFEVRENTKSVPLGSVLDDTIIEVRNDEGMRITEGEGEVYIGSSSRICYVDEEDKSNLVKPVFRSTGDIVKVTAEGHFYVCRNNNIIKRFGHRINLTQIEYDILKQTAISNICVWLEDKSKLVLFITIQEHNALTKQKIIDKLRIRLLHSLSKECVPDHIEIIPNFPLSRHGKIDRKSLGDIYNNLSNDRLTSNRRKDPAEIFKSLWGKYLGLSFTEIERYTSCNFFELGGTSIAAIQYLTEFSDCTGADYSNDLTTLLFEKSLKNCCDFIKDSKVRLVRKRRLNSENDGCKSKLNVLNMENSIKIQICWKYNLGACVDSSPIILKHRARVAIGSFSHIFAILDSKNGNVISQIVLPDAIESGCCVSPCTDYVFTGCYDGYMYKIEVLTGKIIWKYKTHDRIKCIPCLCLQNEALVFGSYDKHVHCVNIQSGEPVWKTLVSESITSSLLCYNKTIHVATTFGTCLCLVESDGSILWKHSIGAPIFGSPCVFNNTIIWPDVSGILHSFSCKNGQKLWTFKVNGHVFSSLRVYDNFIIFGCDDHNIYCVQINENDCNLKYQVLLDSAVNSTPNLLEFNGKVYVIAVSIKGNVYVIEFNTGMVVEHLCLPGEIFSSPAVEKTCFYVGCRDNNLYCLNIVNEGNK